MTVQYVEQRHRPGMFLGRHVDHDPRPLEFAHPVLPKSALKPVAWQRRIGILDQGEVGSCTGNALTGVLGTDSFGRTAPTQVTVKADAKGVFKAGSYALDEAFALRAYTLNTRLDNVPGEYPGEDTGSTGVACGKTGRALGLLSGYTHAFTMGALKTALQAGPVMLGIPWLNSMFEPRADGTIPVVGSSGLAGGHEIACTAWDGADRFRIDNSWGTSWGDAGSGWFVEADLAWLLSQGGDVTVPVYAPTPGPTPSPTPAGYTAADLAADVRALLTAKGV
jgi:hypothetical protein